jgi:hypothetical protein
MFQLSCACSPVKICYMLLTVTFSFKRNTNFERVTFAFRCVEVYTIGVASGSDMYT